nr:unnamed protein product [Digitaria exilis]
MAWASQLPPGYSIEIVRSSVTADFIVTILWIVPNHRPLTCRNTSQASFRLMYHFVPFPVQGTWLCTAFPVTGA